MPDGPVQTPLTKFEVILGEHYRALTVANPQETEEEFLKQVDLATLNNVPSFLPGEVPSYKFITQAAQEFLDARQRVLDAKDAWKAAGSPPDNTPYWTTRG